MRIDVKTNLDISMDFPRAEIFLALMILLLITKQSLPLALSR
jgi:hypothetical protein